MAKIFLYGVQGQYGNYCAALRAADGTAECIRHGTLPVWGVQWHPERQSYALRRPDAADGAAVFEAFAAQVEQE